MFIRFHSTLNGKLFISVKMFLSIILLLLALVVHTLGNPAPNSENSVCQHDPLYLVFLNPLINGPAVSFCRSYLHIPVATATISAVHPSHDRNGN